MEPAETTDRPLPVHGVAADLAHLGRGLCMGCADVVPGVSGGTVALILGIYERLVTAISHVDGPFLRLLREKQWLEACRYLDLRFLVALGGGIGIGVVTMSLVINRLLTHATSRAVTLAAFFGMIVASAIIIAGMIRPVSRPQAIRASSAGLLAAVFSVWVARLEALSGVGDPSYGWIFVCGGIAICAMILPGISGAMILLVLGVYVHLTEVPHNILSGQQLGPSLATLAVFGSGCAISLILFSKILRWLLQRHHVVTMSILCGLMFGALVKLWPFQRDLTPEIEKFKYKRFGLVWPDAFSGHVLLVLTVIAAAAAVVFVADQWVKRAARQSASP